MKNLHMNYKYLLHVLFVVSICLLNSCKEFVEIDPPRNEIVSETIFSTDETAFSAMMGTYSRIAVQGSIFIGNLEVQLGLAADNLINETGISNYLPFYENELDPTSYTITFNYWANTFKVIFNANMIIEGMENNGALTPAIRDQFHGEALFLRAFLHFHLTNLFGDVPYLTSTDVEANDRAIKYSKAKVYEYIVADLTEAISLLSDDYSYSNNERIRPNKYAAMALLARVYLYDEQWQKAEDFSSQVIDEVSLYHLLDTDNISKVFLDNPDENTEAIWQLSCKGIYGRPGTTFYGDIFVPRADGSTPFASTFGTTKISLDLINAFDTAVDFRYKNWIKEYGTNGFFNRKLKNGFSNASVVGDPEHIPMLRLAEQYLIRAEARAHLNDFDGSLEDLNVIRERADVPNETASDHPTLLNAISLERRFELFAENGHRWFDLIRTGKAAEVLSVKKPGWDAKDVLFPLPEADIKANPNLLPQNPLY